MSKLCVVADSEDSPQYALVRALPLAEKLGCGIHFVGFVYFRQLEQTSLLQGIAAADLQLRLMEARQEQLDAFLESIDCKGVKITTQIVWEKNIADWLSKHCKEENYRLLLKSGRRSERLWHTSSDQQLMRSCPTPVMIVRSKTWKKKARILVSVDLGTTNKSKQKLNRQLLAEARLLADTLNRELHCIYVIQIPQVINDLDIVNKHEVTRKVKAKVAPLVEELKKEFNIDNKRFHIISGVASKKIASTASKINADMVVMGTVGRRGVKAALIGNTAEETLSLLRTDLLTVAP